MSRTDRLILLFASLAAAGLYAAVPAGAQSWRTMTSARQVWEQEPIDVHIRYGAGTLSLGSAEAPLLYQMEVRYDEEVSTPVANFDEEDRVLELGVRLRDRNRSRTDMDEGSAATINLSRQVPIDLDLEFGAGKAEIDLGGISLERLELSTGASETTVRFGSPNPIRAEEISIEAGAADLEVIALGNAGADRVSFRGGVGETVLDFSGDWTRSAEASVEMGIGSLTIRVPRDVGVRIDRSSFLTTFDAPGMERRDDGYYSATWETAAHQLAVDLSAALGSIDIEWID